MHTISGHLFTHVEHASQSFFMWHWITYDFLLSLFALLLIYAAFPQNTHGRKYAPSLSLPLGFPVADLQLKVARCQHQWYWSINKTLIITATVL